MSESAVRIYFYGFQTLTDLVLSMYSSAIFEMSLYVLRVSPQPNERGICPLCEEVVIARCGEINVVSCCEVNPLRKRFMSLD
ncbi:MAG: hypothetical protein E4H14_20505 [Candidatus Thorarchaeota archaeon]|nr:MAG: hypothetical protein E4H14_20505 [Candidatus Thorarchaeota archaeon]